MKKYTQILGKNVAGEVVEVGEDVSAFMSGDRVIAYVSHPWHRSEEVVLTNLEDIASSS